MDNLTEKNILPSLSQLGRWKCKKFNDHKKLKIINTV